MREDEKGYINIPEELAEKFTQQGYQLVTWELQSFFDPYYDAMNDHWCANTSFLNLWGWKETYICYYKVYQGYILLTFFLRTVGEVAAGPCLGTYTKEGVTAVVDELKRDFTVFGYPLKFYDITPWMLPYYKDSNVEFEVEDLRDYMDYVFTPEQFLEGMDQQDDRYRYRYFKRKNDYETVELTPDMLDECIAFLEARWCEGKTCDDCQYGCLVKVMDNILSHIDTFRAHGILVRVDGEPVGVCIVTSRNGLGIYHYKNAVNRIKGINEYLLRECFERYMQDVDMINYTEDMGVENLRYYKEHMAPSYTLLSKYTLTEKE